MLIGQFNMRVKANPAVQVLVMGGQGGGGKADRMERKQRLDDFLRGWRYGHFEGRPCQAMADFEPEKSWPLVVEAQEAGLVRLWVDEIDGLYRGYLTDLGRARKEALDG